MPEMADDQPEGYYESKVADIKAGKKVWVARNFDSELGRMLDFYADRRHIGSIEIDRTHPDWRGLRASQPMVPDEVKGSVYITDAEVPLGEAMRLIEQEYERRREAN
jgi:hypothetical protein